MEFWTLLAAGIFVMVLLYLILGSKRIWITMAIYTILAVATWFVIHFIIKDFYRYDFFALIIPYLIILPIHISMKFIIVKHFQGNDDEKSKVIVAQYNRFLHQLWIFEAFILFGLGLSIVNSIYEGFNALNIITLSILSFILMIIPAFLVKKSYRKTFSFILVIGSEKKVFKYHTNRSILFIKKVLGEQYDVYQRGIYRENNENLYLYYIKEDVTILNQYFTPYTSELIDYLKPFIDSNMELKLAYRDFIDNQTKDLVD